MPPSRDGRRAVPSTARAARSAADEPGGGCVGAILRIALAGVHSSPFLAACRREPVPYTPIWLMRQAGRYMPEYRAVREKLGFLELCHSPDAAAEVTVTAAERHRVHGPVTFLGSPFV